MNSKLLSCKSIAFFCITMLFFVVSMAQKNEPVPIKKTTDVKLNNKEYQWVEGEPKPAPSVIVTSTNVTPSTENPKGTPVQSSEVLLTKDCKKITNKSEIKDDNTPYYTANEMPAYIEGKGRLPFHISQTARYPAEARKDKAEGIVVVQIIVEKDGSISNPKVIQSVHPKLDEEALRVIGTLNKFIPGKQNEKPVRCYYNIPVPFVLQKK